MAFHPAGKGRIPAVENCDGCPTRPDLPEKGMIGMAGY
jgi:hypothetical protein